MKILKEVAPEEACNAKHVEFGNSLGVDNDTFYMYYCAIGNKGRTIRLPTSKPIKKITN
jgi:hypothetical protein